MAAAHDGGQNSSPRSGMAASSVCPVAESIVELKSGTSGKPFRQISMVSSLSKCQGFVTGFIGNTSVSRPSYCFFIGVSIFTNNVLGSSARTTVPSVED